MADLHTMFDVAGKSVIITGGASGIGRGYAEIMAEHGARVCILDVDGEGIDATASAIGGETWGQVVDVTDRPGMAAAFDRVAERHGAVDVVFANAGVDAGPGFLDPEGNRNPEGHIENFGDDRWDKVIGVNLTGVYNTVKQAAIHMKPARSGRIVVTSSVASQINEAIVGTPYMAAKAGVDHFVRNMAMELGTFGILINCINPGPFITNIAGGRLNNPEDRAAFEAQSLIGRIGTLEDVKGLALFLASPSSSYMTGAQINIDGGSRLRIS